MSDRLLRRRASDRGRVVAGVCGGIADYLGVDAALVRVLLVLLVVFGFGSGLVGYLIGWALIPDAGTDRSWLEGVLGS